MSIEKAVINASPLILLCKGKLAELLPKLFKEIIVPEAVWDEVSRGEDIASQKIIEYVWLHRGAIQVAKEVTV